MKKEKYSPLVHLMNFMIEMLTNSKSEKQLKKKKKIKVR